ncbi:hypothetical protein HQO12_24010 [Rhodococcus fascians]|uniref:hypothetical protein n=1 Tax=Rhodococcoides fascians TaxID=1828 RepID=UPI00195876FC|nr:hypothetical protein [Rhodococcus fascians]MBM7242563.1 hypothetical protein [Rhodococcus fascians]MBY3811981.1 hypothetical protein [Rhodococcus fascians]MBY3840711.1 hypothetical protein [Rhodococcus fascians]MBY3848157.1 hypothetical protein [Rhodococcus fascians]MBY3853278.1 hypothetical protein [Rhodococcus fascians]
MATIGTAIESGSMQTVLLEPTSGEVLAHSTTSLDPDVTAVLPRAISDMRAEAATLNVSVDAVAVVHRSESERAELATAVTDESTVFVSASQSFLSWLARTKDLADASTVLLYYMGEHGVSISLADAADATLTPARNAALDSMSPERIGSTIPLAWEVVDESGKKPQAVALFGDRSSNRDLIDILSLGLGVPVVRVGAADRVAACGAAWLASVSVEDQALVVTEAVDESEEAAGPETIPSVVPASPVTATGRSSSATGGRKLIFAAVLLAGVASAGVAVAATLPSNGDATARQSADRRDSGADLAGAARYVDPTTVAPLVPGLPVDALPKTLPPTADSAVEPTTTPTTGTTQQWTPQQGTPQQGTPPSWVPPGAAPAGTPKPAAATVDPPQLTVPTVVPEPGKSQEQLEQEAWDRHWQHTGEWIAQELAGG